MNKVFASAAEAVADVPTGASLAVGGFGICGIPSTLIGALLDTGVSDLEAVSNNCGVDDTGLGKLLGAGRLRRMVASYVGENKEFECSSSRASWRSSSTRRARSPSGSARAAPGLAASTPPPVSGRRSRRAKEVRNIDGRDYVLEKPLGGPTSRWSARGRATAGGTWSSARRPGTSSSPRSAARVTIAEVEELVEVGELDPDAIHVPAVFVKRVVALTPEQAADKKIEKRTVRPRRVVEPPRCRAVETPSHSKEA